MEFKFKYVNEEQLMKVIKKVQRERKCKQEGAGLVVPSSKERYLHASKEEECPLSEDVEAYKDSQSVIDTVNKDHSAFSSDNSRPHSFPIEYEAKEKHCGRVNALITRLRNVRKSILTCLDELIVHNETITQKESYKDTVENWDESVQEVKARNCICLIIRQEYPFVMNMRRLNLNTFRQDAVSHLKILLDCHNIALRMLKVFIRGAPYVLELDKSKEKLSSLLERMIALSSVCKLFAVEHKAAVSSKDFLMDDVDRKCVSLLTSGKKRIKLTPKCYHGKDVGVSENLCAHCGVTVMKEDVRNDEVHIPLKKFKKLADQVFGCKKRPTEKIKKRKSHYKEHESIRNSIDKGNVLKEENKTATIKGTTDSHSWLENQVHNANRPESHGDIHVKDKVCSSESKIEVAEEENRNLVEDENPKAQVSYEPFDGSQNDSHGFEENSINNHQIKYTTLQQNSKCSDEFGTEKHLTSSSSINDEQGVGVSPSKDDLKLSDDIIKLSMTTGSISDKVLGECLRRVGGEVDNFVEDFIQKMFLLEFT